MPAYIPNEPMPDCVPELYRQQQEEQDRQFDLAMRRRIGYLANQRKIDKALRTGLPILYYAAATMPAGNARMLTATRGPTTRTTSTA